MAPPRKGGAAAEQAKERLTAVVMADSFTQVCTYFIFKIFQGISFQASIVNQR
jgi:hypothetical protein